MDYDDESFANTVWCVGVGMMVAGSATDLAAFGFAALSLLAPLDGISMCVNAFISQQFLGETIKQLDLVAMGIIITGCTVTVFFGAQGTATVPAAALLQCTLTPSLGLATQETRSLPSTS